MSRNLTSSFPQFNLEMPNSSGHIVYVFDSFKLDRARLMLYRGETEVTLPPKAVEILAVLVENRSEIVSKTELIEIVWKDAFVEDSNLSHYLYLLRKVLGKRSDGGPYIETLRKRGYRFEPDSLSIEKGMNGSNRTTLPPSSKAFQVERRGNVLAVADWREPARAPDDIGPADEVPQRPRRIATGAIGLFMIGALVAVSAGFYLSRPTEPRQNDRLMEQDVTRLTSGIEVMDATISPDGKYFVYHEPDGKLFRMWLQQTGHATRQEVIPASERLLFTKTFSPDGQFIYFLAADSLGGPSSIYRVTTLGGPVTKVVDDVDSGISFSPDGRQMVFARAVGEKLNYIIKASDGSGEEHVIYAASSGFGSSAWSPDGKSIVTQFTADEKTLGCGLAAVEPESGRATKVSEEQWDACGRMEWAPDGSGFYMIGTRLGEAITLRRDQVYFVSYPQGRSRKVTSEGSRHQLTSLGVTREGSVLAVPYNRSSQLWVMDPNGDSRSAGPITSGITDGRSGIAPAADGRVAYVSRTGENLNVWIMNQDGSDKKQVTDTPSTIEELRSGGDGRYLIFAGYTDKNHSSLFRINSDGGELKQITFGPERQIDSSMSRDGQWLAYDSSIVRGGKVELSLWKQNMDSGERVSLNRNDCQMPHFSPDDKLISCVRGQQDILILSSADGALLYTLRVPAAVTLNNSINFGARWAPDGNSVVYVLNEKGVANLWIHPINGSAPRQLTNFTSGSIYHFAYSVDGTRLFLARGNQIRDALLISELRK
jgi:Tol biopolymer transport system component/DNA-binding winged helix-turn-helix (wHTH) protein